jgi:hypothetical protein
LLLTSHLIPGLSIMLASYCVGWVRKRGGSHAFEPVQSGSC